MQDSIIGYLLGALDDDELAQFESQLRSDLELQAQVRMAARSLEILRQDDDDIEAPEGMVAHTCAIVEAAKYSGQQLSKPGIRSPRDPVGIRGDDESWTLVDVMVACSVVLAACLLFFPAVNNSRYHAQIAGCQNNLRSIGRALIEYSGADANERFPQVREAGNLAVAGMYAPTLKSFGFAPEDHNFFCPTQSVVEDRFEGFVPEIPTLKEVQLARGKTLEVMQRRMGGDYGYTLGLVVAGKLKAIRNRSRTHFALMSDSPAILNAASCSKQAKASVHRNILFESGRVRTVCVRCDCWCGDQLFTNDRGEVSAGLHEGDAVIGPSNATAITTVSFTQ